MSILMMLYVAWRKRCRSLQGIPQPDLRLRDDSIDCGNKKALAKEGFRKFGSPVPNPPALINDRGVAWRGLIFSAPTGVTSGKVSGESNDRGHKKALAEEGFPEFGSPGRTRTSDQLINSFPSVALSGPEGRFSKT